MNKCEENEVQWLLLVGKSDIKEFGERCYFGILFACKCISYTIGENSTHKKLLYSTLTRTFTSNSHAINVL